MEKEDKVIITEKGTIMENKSRYLGGPHFSGGPSPRLPIERGTRKQIEEKHVLPPLFLAFQKKKVRLFQRKELRVMAALFQPVPRPYL